jgi:AraC family transcriptional regulator
VLAGENRTLGYVTTEAYRARLRRVLAHIDRHLEQALTLERLAAVAAFSKYHFHRQFRGLYRVGVHEYVELGRLKRASYRLAFRRPGRTIDVALASGYESANTFARAFKKVIGQTPSAFRTAPAWEPWHAAFAPFTAMRSTHMPPAYAPTDVKIVDFPATRIAALEHRGDPRRIGDTIRRFIAWRRENALPPARSATFNVLYTDEVGVPPEEFRFDLCAATEREIAPNEQGVVAKTLPAGRCAVLRHVGSDATLRAAVGYLYAEWLPASGKELRDSPPFFKRVTFYPDVPEHEAITDVFLPLV